MCDWCRCGNTNFARRRQCNRCGDSKPENLSSGGKGGGSVVCFPFGHRYARFQTSQSFPSAKMRLSAARAYSTRMTGSAQCMLASWVCKALTVGVGRCGNVNWARRSSCNVCQHNRFQKKEDRGGVGGGFLDREEVVYVNRCAGQPSSDGGSHALTPRAQRQGREI